MSMSLYNLVLAEPTTAECPVIELPSPWLMNLMYCAWHGPFHTELDVDTLAGCIGGLEDDTEPFRNETLLAQFTGLVRTPCATNCLLASANAIRSTYADLDFSQDCQLVSQTWAYVRNFMDSTQCVAAKNNGLSAFHLCASLPTTTEAPPDTTTTTTSTTSTTSKATDVLVAASPTTTLVLLVLALAVVRTD